MADSDKKSFSRSQTPSFFVTSPFLMNDSKDYVDNMDKLKNIIVSANGNIVVLSEVFLCLLFSSTSTALTIVVMANREG